MSDVSKAVDQLFPPSGRELWVGMALGLLVGALGAAFIAPRSGAATREILRERGLELKDRAGTMLRGRDQGSPL
jgi:gas vesicle protein